METPTYIALAHEGALMRRLNVVANNLANATTSGFKAERLVFSEVLAKVGDGQRISMVKTDSGYRDLTDGAVARTGNDFDLAISGPGYFAINTPQGERYTRNGGFTLDRTGRLVTPQGNEVLGQGGAINIPLQDSEIIISRDGVISSKESGEIGRVRLVRFADEQQLRKTGIGLYATEQAPQTLPPEEISVVQGSVEGSNVNPVREISSLIELQRNFEATQRIIEQEHRRQRDAINKIFRPADS